MNYILEFLYRIGIRDIFGLISFVGFGWFLIRRFVLHKAPVSVGAKAVPRELFRNVWRFLIKGKRRSLESM